MFDTCVICLILVLRFDLELRQHLTFIVQTQTSWIVQQYTMLLIDMTGTLIVWFKHILEVTFFPNTWLQIINSV